MAKSTNIESAANYQRLIRVTRQNTGARPKNDVSEQVEPFHSRSFRKKNIYILGKYEDEKASDVGVLPAMPISSKGD